MFIQSWFVTDQLVCSLTPLLCLSAVHAELAKALQLMPNLRVVIQQHTADALAAAVFPQPPDTSFLDGELEPVRISVSLAVRHSLCPTLDGL